MWSRFDFLESREVIGHVTIRLLRVVHSDHASICHRYKHMALKGIRVTSLTL